MAYYDMQTPIIFCGAGKWGKYLAKKAITEFYMNVVCFIDRSLSGDVEVSPGVNVPCHGYDEIPGILSENEDCIIIIATRKSEFFLEIESKLINLNVQPERIVSSWNDYLSNVFVPSEKCYCLHSLNHMLIGSKALRFCCGPLNNYYLVSELPLNMQNHQSLDVALSTFLERRKTTFNAAKNGLIPIMCSNCPSLEKKSLPQKQPQITFVALSFYPAVCNADCVYCNCGFSNKQLCNPKEAKKFEIHKFAAKTLTRLRQDNILSNIVTCHLTAGEVSIASDKDYILDYAIENTGDTFVISTTGIIFDQKIAYTLSANINSSLRVDMDAGTPETYLLVKGTNKFYQVFRNLKKYCEHGNVMLKYIIIPNYNDDEANFKGIVNIAKELGLKSMNIDREYKHIKRNDKFITRKILFAAAKLNIMLMNEGIEGKFRLHAWSSEHIKEVERFTILLKNIEEGESDVDNY